MNKEKGQVLVVFIILIPVFFMLAAIFIDLGIVFMEKRNIDNVVKDTIKYGVKHLELDEEILKYDLGHIIYDNIEDINYLDINIENEIIKIRLNKKQEGTFSIIFNKYNYDIESNYRGYMNNDEIVIKKE
ncbi:MAG: hypothetical protein PHD10_02645 [Bacilli bacterium]|nr:hypothetical protein [Bacilli bacterium]MDD4608010.1 hypothetical protein [Bacilli bacterium]